jgi:uncharacterized DUF497 family protein
MKSIRYHRNNLAKHGIDVFEAEEALYDGWKRKRRDGDFYEILGRTGDGRYLQLVVEIRSDEIWVFHGRDMNTTEKRRYQRK